MVLTVMYMDMPVCKIYISDNKKEVTVENLTKNNMLLPFAGGKVDIFRVYGFLKSRCYEDCRADLQEILTVHGMTNNNPWEWVRKTHGVMYDDQIWIKFNDESIKWEEVRIK